MCVHTFRDLPSRRSSLGIMCQREEILLFPNVLVFPLKRQLFTCMKVPVLMGSLKVNGRPKWNAMNSHPQVAHLSGEPTCTRTALYIYQRSTTPVFFNVNFLMDPGWPASLGRFQLNLRHYLRSQAAKTVASRHKCDQHPAPARKQFSIAFRVQFNCFLKNKIRFLIFRCNSKWPSSIRWFSQI